jgi:hypothetical protein
MIRPKLIPLYSRCERFRAMAARRQADISLLTYETNIRNVVTKELSKNRPALAWCVLTRSQRVEMGRRQMGRIALRAPRVAARRRISGPWT